MKKSELKQIIKEEVKLILNEDVSSFNIDQAATIDAYEARARIELDKLFDSELQVLLPKQKGTLKIIVNKYDKDDTMQEKLSFIENKINKEFKSQLLKAAKDFEKNVKDIAKNTYNKYNK